MFISIPSHVHYRKMDKENLSTPIRKRRSDRYALRDLQTGIKDEEQTKLAPTKELLAQNQSNNEVLARSQALTTITRSTKSKLPKPVPTKGTPHDENNEEKEISQGARKKVINNTLQTKSHAGEKFSWNCMHEIDEYFRNRQENLKCPEVASLNFKARLDILNWMLTMKGKIYSTDSTYFMFVRVFDDVLTFKVIPPKEYKIVACTIISIANFYFLRDESMKEQDYVRLCRIELSELCNMKDRLLKFCGPKINAHQPGFFAKRYLRDIASRSTYLKLSQINHAAWFIMKTFTYTPRFSQYGASAIASSAIYLAFDLLVPETNWANKIYRNMFPPDDKDALNEVLMDMRLVLHKLSLDEDGFKGTILKYGDKKLKDAATEVYKCL